MKDDQIKTFAQMLDPEDERISALLQKVAAQTNVNRQFQIELELRLKKAYKPKGIVFRTSLAKLAATLASILALIALIFLMDWVIRPLVPQSRLASGNIVTPTLAYPQATPTPSENPIGQARRRPAPAIPGTARLSTCKRRCRIRPPRQTFIVCSPTSMRHLMKPSPWQHALAFRVKFTNRRGSCPARRITSITDGKQWMSVRSDNYFTYYADYSQSQALPGTGINTTEAAANIEAFLKSHGFNFKYKIDSTDMWGKYYVTPLTPDGFAVHIEDLRPSGLLFTLDDSGQVASVQANLVDYQPVGTYGIRTAQAAWKILLNSEVQAGKLEWMSSPSGPSRAWQRTYPLGQTETIYSYVSSFPSAGPGKAPLIMVGMYPATGNVAGLDQVPSNTFVEATGQFVADGGITKFKVDSWKVTPLTEDGIEGTLELVNGQVTLSAQEGNFQLADVPADISLPFKNAFVVGVRLGNTFDWTSIDNRGGHGGGGGGGGGGGEGFYKINFSGTPVPLPTTVPTALPPDQQPTGQTIQGQRGLLNVTIYKQPDGSQSVEYALVPWNGTGYSYMILEGDLQALQSDQNRPVDVWGSVDHFNQDGNPVIKVDRYEMPFPDAQFQVLRGTQKIVQLAGQPATLFTTDAG